MNRDDVLTWIAVGCLILGALLCLVSWIPTDYPSIAAAHGWLGPVLVLAAGVCWLSELKPRDLFFGVVVGGSTALIAQDKVLLGMIAVALICIGRRLQFQVEGW